MKTCPTCQRSYPDDFSLCPRDGAPLAAPAKETEAQLAAGLYRRFRIVRRLGAGGMGTAFLAEQIGVGNRPVALKVLNRKLLDDPDFLLRFQNEAGSMGRIHHPNVVTIYESAQADDGTPYIAMEYLEGETLRGALKRRGVLPLPEVTEILQQAAKGLNAAHKLGIIHRDLKPDNIFLTRGDEGEPVVKVVDFGIAKLRESSMHTETGMVLGTPAYMSYEQASGMRSDELDARSDIYSLGVVVYEMLTGRAPFHSDTPLGYVRKHVLENPPPFRAVAQSAGMPPAVESAVMKALAKDRDLRYASALDFARELTSAAQSQPRAEAPEPLPSTRVVPPPASEVSQPLPSPKVALLPPPSREPVAPIPLPEIAQAKADTAVQTPPPAPPERIVETPTAPPQESKPRAAASHQAAAAKPPQFPTRSKPPTKMKIVVIAVVVLILIVAAAWYFRRPANPQFGRRQGGPGAPQAGTAPQVPGVETPAPASPTVIPPTPPAKPAEIVIQTSPSAEVYVDEQFVGRASPQGRLAVPNPRPGDHALRVALAGKQDYQQQVKVTAGETSNVRAALADIENSKPKLPVEMPRRGVSAPAAGTGRENPKDGLKYVWIPPGAFTMGCSPRDSECNPTEKPAHQVTITRGFWIGQTVVTVAAYRRFAASTGVHMPPAPDFNSGWNNQDMPIVSVSWDDATAFCGWARGRLPTEAEWEYAARAGSTEARYGPIDEVAWYSFNSSHKTHEVGQKRANGFGLYDMLGNVWEWVHDWYNQNYYQHSPSQDPTGPASGRFRVLRGGSWFYYPKYVRVSYRDRLSPGFRNNSLGFRCGGEVFAP